MSHGAVYGRREVLFLLSLSEREARDLSENVQCCAATWGHQQHAALSPADLQPVPLIVRWHDVQLARDRVCASLSAEHDRVVQRRVNGETGMALGERLGISDVTVRDKLQTTLDAILDELGGELVVTEAPSRRSACLSCGDRPRTRIVSYGAKQRGKPRRRYERLSSLCEACLAAARGRDGHQVPQTATLMERDTDTADRAAA
jgi:hypothetical protein